jgi:hypothetical protein
MKIKHVLDGHVAMTNYFHHRKLQLDANNRSKIVNIERNVAPKH